MMYEIAESDIYKNGYDAGHVKGLLDGVILATALFVCVSLGWWLTL